MVPRGGHNPLEPAQFGVPVVMGPSFENFRGVVSDMRAAVAIDILKGAAVDAGSVNFETVFDSEIQHPLRDQLAQICIELLTDRREAEDMGERGRQVFLAQGGAATRTTAALLSMVSRPELETPDGMATA